MNFIDKIVVITGASRGIGATVAAAFARQGAVVWANHPEMDAEQHRQAIEQWRRAEGLTPESVRPVSASVADAQQVAAMFETVRQGSGALDILVNNAGINRDHTVAKMTDAEWREVMQVNLDGAFYCCRSARPLLREGGRIINISSVVALTGSFGAANYAASKAGVLALTKTLALELAARRITVNAVSPGYIDTAMMRGMPAHLAEQLVQRIPLKRKGTPEEVAACVLFLASEAASYVTGQNLGVNGGFYLGA